VGERERDTQGLKCSVIIAGRGDCVRNGVRQSDGGGVTALYLPIHTTTVAAAFPADDALGRLDNDNGTRRVSHDDGIPSTFHSVLG